jgi:hypothetical protein
MRIIAFITEAAPVQRILNHIGELAAPPRVALIPPPRLHRHRYHGVLAPNSPLRAAATAYGRDEASSKEQPPPASASPPAAAAPSFRSPFRSPARYLWAMLLAR